MSKQNKRRKKGLFNFVVLVVIILALGAVGVNAAKKKAVSYAKDYAVKEVIRNLPNLPEGVDEEKIEAVAEDVNNAMSEEDQKAVDQMIEQHINTSTITKAASYATSGDLSGLKDYIKNQISEEEKQKLYDLYESYGDQIPGILEKNGINIQDFQ